MAEWLKATDCKSVLSRVRRFESFSAHAKLTVFSWQLVYDCKLRTADFIDKRE